MTHHQPLSIESLKFTVDFNKLALSDIPRKDLDLLGQMRAKKALEFGLSMNRPRYHIFVTGEPSLGKLSLVTQALNKIATNQIAPNDYLYVENFDNPKAPLALQLPNGEGQKFIRHIESLIDDLLLIFPTLFETPVYRKLKTSLERQFNQSYDLAIEKVKNKARSFNMALIQDDECISFTSLNSPNTQHDNTLEESLAEHQADDLMLLEELEDYLTEALQDMPKWRKTLTEEIENLNNETIKHALDPLFAKLENHYANIDDAIAYLSTLKPHLTLHIEAILNPDAPPATRRDLKKRLLENYLPHLLIDTTRDTGAPIIHEANPTYANLFGHIDYSNHQGTLVANYQTICPGALHAANGGYLILDAEKLLTNLSTWECLKNALLSEKIKIDHSLYERTNQAIILKPEVIPLNVKIILIGSSEIYYLLEETDTHFKELFKVLVDFSYHIPCNSETINQFALLIRKHANESGANPISPEAIAALIEYSCRLAESQHHFSARINDVLDIIGEANLISQQRQHPQIQKTDIEQALVAQAWRYNSLSEEILEDMLAGNILIDTSGEAIGKINGLTVLEVGTYSFGTPVRITTTVYPGSRGIVDIERESELGQAIHSKGVMILTGYLGHFYAQHFPLAISASIAIEQSYSHIDGDSASLAELCCLISALTRTPIKQSIAITGSINQYGEVQAIGGVNEKIEGFFRLCQARGLDGSQAVIIPVANTRNLMLNQPILDAVANGLFAVYTVATADEALELLTGETAGKPDPDGNYPEHSINFKAISRLREISEMATEEDKEEAS